MKTSKHNWSNDSRKQQLLFFQFGLIIAIAFTIMAFEWTVRKPEVKIFKPGTTDIVDWLPEDAPRTTLDAEVPVRKPSVRIERIIPVPNSVTVENPITPTPSAVWVAKQPT